MHIFDEVMAAAVARHNMLHLNSPGFA